LTHHQSKRCTVRKRAKIKTDEIKKNYEIIVQGPGSRLINFGSAAGFVRCIPVDDFYLILDYQLIVVLQINLLV